MKKDYILDAASAYRKLERMAYEIVENNIDEKELILAGIRESGSVVARCIEQLLAKIGSLKTTVITLSLDKKHPKEVKISQDIDFSGKVIIVIDDVANSGKTMLYAMKPFLDYHPKKIQTLALVERTHKAYPISTDYVGVSVSTTFQEHIYVEVDGEKVTGAYLS